MTLFNIERCFWGITAPMSGRIKCHDSNTFIYKTAADNQYIGKKE